MPYQVNWHFVVMKFQGLVQTVGAFAAAAGALIGIMTSAAHTFTAHAPATPPKMIALKMLSLVMRVPSLAGLLFFVLSCWAEDKRPTDAPDIICIMWHLRHSKFR